MDKKKLNRLKLVLVEKDKTGIWLAEQLGVTAVTVSKWCSNITQPTLPMLDKIAELLECDTRLLINNILYNDKNEIMLNDKALELC